MDSTGGILSERLVGMGCALGLSDEGKKMKIDIDSKFLTLTPNANTDHESVAGWYGNYGAQSFTESYGDIEVQAVDAEWLAAELGSKTIAAKLRASRPNLTDDEVEGMIDLARRVWGAAEGVVADLERAVAAYKAHDLDGVLEALRSARSQESDHGDDPATSNLAAKLLTEWAQVEK